MPKMTLDDLEKIKQAHALKQKKIMKRQKKILEEEIKMVGHAAIMYVASIAFKNPESESDIMNEIAALIEKRFHIEKEKAGRVVARAVASVANQEPAPSEGTTP